MRGFRRSEVFGAWGHRWIVEDPFTPGELAELEAQTARNCRRSSGTSCSEPARPSPVRHRDYGTWLVRFTGRVLVVCPTCGGRALVAPLPGLTAPEYSSSLLFQPRRLACDNCGAAADWTGIVASDISASQAHVAHGNLFN